MMHASDVSVSQRNKDVVRRLVDEVFNAGRMDAIDALYAPSLAPAARKWLGHPPTGRRFEAIDEVTFFRLSEGRIVSAWGIEDTLGRLEQLGLR